MGWKRSKDEEGVWVSSVNVVVVGKLGRTSVPKLSNFRISWRWLESWLRGLLAGLDVLAGVLAAWLAAWLAGWLTALVAVVVSSLLLKIKK